MSSDGVSQVQRRKIQPRRPSTSSATTSGYSSVMGMGTRKNRACRRWSHSNRRCTIFAFSCTVWAAARRCCDGAAVWQEPRGKENFHPRRCPDFRRGFRDMVSLVVGAMNMSIVYFEGAGCSTGPSGLAAISSP